MRRRGFYIEVDWSDLARLLIAAALIFAGRLAWHWELGIPGLLLGVPLWWAGACEFAKWIARHAMTADEWQSSAVRAARLLAAAAILLYSLDAAGVGAAWIGEWTSLFATLAVGIWAGQRIARHDRQSGQAGSAAALLDSRDLR